MGVDYVAYKAWFTNNPDKPGFRCYESSDVATYESLPADGHQATCLFVSYDGRITRQIHTGQPFMFFWRGPDGLVIDGDQGTRSELQARYPGATIIRARSITLEVYQQIEKEVMAATQPCVDCGGKG